MKLSNEKMLEMYGYMLLSRRLDERAWILHRQGKIAFHISGIGHEAAQVGAAFALERGKDFVLPYYRDLALMLVLGFTPRDFILSLYGKKGEPSSGGRQMPSHWSKKASNVVSHSSPVATQTTHAAGIGLGIKMRGEDAVVLTTIGEGSTTQGEWYEGVNWGSVHKLPVIYMVENNEYAISVPQDKQMGIKNVADRAKGMGLPGVVVDGTDMMAVYKEVSLAVARARSGEGPTLIEVKTFRMTPHSSDDDDRSYRSREDIDFYKANDPLEKTRLFLETEGVLTPEITEKLDSEAKQAVDEATTFGERAPYPEPEEAAYPVYVEEVRHG